MTVLRGFGCGVLAVVFVAILVYAQVAVKPRSDAYARGFEVGRSFGSAGAASGEVSASEWAAFCASGYNGAGLPSKPASYDGEENADFVDGWNAGCARAQPR